MDWFVNYPVVEYDGRLTRDVTLRAGLARDVIARLGVFYPYRIKDWERPDTIAFDYYGDSKFAWLVYLSNQVVDPYFDWPMTDWDFNLYLKDKYGSVETAMATTHHYEREDGRGVWMTPETYAHLTPEQRPLYVVEVDCYDWENSLNEGKKNIQLLSRRYAQQAAAELATVLSGDRA